MEPMGAPITKAEQRGPFWSEAKKIQAVLIESKSPSDKVLK